MVQSSGCMGKGGGVVSVFCTLHSVLICLDAGIVRQLVGMAVHLPNLLQFVLPDSLRRIMCRLCVYAVQPVLVAGAAAAAITCPQAGRAVAVVRIHECIIQRHVLLASHAVVVYLSGISLPRALLWVPCATLAGIAEHTCLHHTTAGVRRVLGPHYGNSCVCVPCCGALLLSCPALEPLFRIRWECVGCWWRTSPGKTAVWPAVQFV